VADDFEDIVVALDILGAGFEGDAHQRVFVGRGRGNDELPAAVEEERDVAGGAHLPAAALEDLADLAGGAVAVVGDNVDEDGDAAGAEALVRQLLHLLGAELTGAALDGPLDVVARHRDFARLVDGVTELEVHGRVTAAVARGDDDGPAELAPQLAALGVDG